MSAMVSGLYMVRLQLVIWNNPQTVIRRLFKSKHSIRKWFLQKINIYMQLQRTLIAYNYIYDVNKSGTRKVSCWKKTQWSDSGQGSHQQPWGLTGQGSVTSYCAVDSNYAWSLSKNSKTLPHCIFNQLLQHVLKRSRNIGKDSMGVAINNHSWCYTVRGFTQLPAR